MARPADFIVASKDEIEMRDLAQQLLDRARAIVSKVEMPPEIEHEGLAREMAALDISTQTLFMADFLGGKGIEIDEDQPVFIARQAGIASGLGQIIGSNSSAIKVAKCISQAVLTMEKAALMRFPVSAEQARKHDKGDQA